MQLDCSTVVSFADETFFFVVPRVDLLAQLDGKQTLMMSPPNEHLVEKVIFLFEIAFSFPLHQCLLCLDVLTSTFHFS